MSKKYEWWPFALAMIRKHPVRSQKIKDLRQSNITASVSGMPRSGGAFRTAETVALKELPRHEQRKHDAVQTAIQRTMQMPEAKARLDVIRLSLWGKDTLRGASYKLHISESTAENYRWDFVMMTGVAHDLVTEEEYQADRKKRYKKKSLMNSDLK